MRADRGIDVGIISCNTPPHGDRWQYIPATGTFPFECSCLKKKVQPNDIPRNNSVQSHFFFLKNNKLPSAITTQITMTIGYDHCQSSSGI